MACGQSQPIEAWSYLPLGVDRQSRGGHHVGRNHSERFDRGVPMAATMRGRSRLGLLLVVIIGLGTATAAPGTAVDVPATTVSAVPLNDCVVPDNTRPQLHELTLSSHRIDVRHHRQRLTVRADLADRGGPGPASGINVVEVYLADVKVPGRQRSFIYLELTAQPDGSWAGSTMFRPGANRGRWFVDLVRLRDKVGFSQPYRPQALAELGVVGGFRVLSRVDRAEPRLISVTLSRTSLRLRPGHTGSVHVRAHASDDLYLKRVDVDALAMFPTSTYARAPGLRRLRSGVWVGRIVFPVWNSRGRYRLTGWVEDGTRKFRYYTSERGYGDGPVPGPGSMLVTGGRVDRHDPSVRITSAPTSTIDVRTADHVVTVRARVRDSASGVERVAVGVDRNVPMHRVSGTRHDGMWEADLLLSHCLTAARTALVVSAHDVAGHAHTARAPLRLLVSDHQWPSVKAFTPKRTGPLRFEWTEDVVGISAETAPVGDFTEHSRIPVPGSWSCQTLTSAPVDCFTGPVRIATYTPTTALTGRLYDASFNPPGVLAVTDLAGNPATHYTWAFPVR
jgi:hypothetical protein